MKRNELKSISFSFILQKKTLIIDTQIEVPPNVNLKQLSK